MKKRKPKVWYCEIYKLRFEFCIGWPRNDFYHYYSKTLNGSRPRSDFDKISGICVQFENPTGICIWVDSKDKRHKNRALMHECIHAACFTLDIRGVGIDWPTCEPLTYLAESLFYQAQAKER